jgi:hypothetical protein
MGACDGFQIRNRHDYEFCAVWSCIGTARKRFGRNWGSHHAGHWQHWKSGNRPRQRRGITRRHCNQPRLLAPESVGHGHPRSATTCASDTGPAESNQAIQLSPGERACGFDHGSSPSTAAPRTPQRPRAPPRRVQSSLLFGVGGCVLEGERLLLAMYGLLREMMQVAPPEMRVGQAPLGPQMAHLRQSPQLAIRLQFEFIC